MLAIRHLSLTRLTAQLTDGIEIKRHAHAATRVATAGGIAHRGAGQNPAGTTTTLGPELGSLPVLSDSVTLQRPALRIGVGAVYLSEVHVVYR